MGRLRSAAFSFLLLMPARRLRWSPQLLNKRMNTGEFTVEEWQQIAEAPWGKGAGGIRIPGWQGDIGKMKAPDAMRWGLYLCRISSCFSSCILKQNAVFEVKKAALESLSRFKKACKNGHIPGISQYMAVSAMKRAGDSDTNAHPCRIGGADFLPFGAA